MKGKETLWHRRNRGLMLTQLFSEMKKDPHYSHKDSHSPVKDPEVPHCPEVPDCPEVPHYSEVHHVKQLIIDLVWKMQTLMVSADQSHN